MNARQLHIRLSVFAALLLASATAARADEMMLKLSQCPALVQRTFTAEAKGAHLENVFKETENESTVYNALVTINGKNYEINVDEDGTLIDKNLDEEVVESEVPFSEAPAGVQKTMRDEAEGSNIEKLEKTAQGDKSFYEAGVAINGHNYWLMVDHRGRLMEKRLGFEIDEATLEIDQAPAAVQKTLKHVAKGFEIKTLEKTTENGKSEFDAFVEIDGRKYAIRVGDDGTLIEKTVDIAADEEELQLIETPAAVQHTLRTEAHSAHIEGVVRKTEGDDTLYGASLELGGKPYWIIVNSDGLLVSKQLDED